MATWISHLRLAETFRDRFDNESFPWFLIGNIAPDSGVVDHGAKSYRPPPEISHFRSKNFSGRWNTRNLDFYNCHVVPYCPKDEAAFKLGYFTHLFLDELWTYYLFKPMVAACGKEGVADRNYFWDKKENWAYPDFLFLEENRTWEIWRIFSSLTYGKDWLDFYPSSAIDSKLRSIRDYYSRDMRNREEDPLMSADRVDMLIGLSHYWISKGLELLEEGRGEGYQTVMALMEASFECFRSDFGDLKKDYDLLF